MKKAIAIVALCALPLGVLAGVAGAPQGSMAADLARHGREMSGMSPHEHESAAGRPGDPAEVDRTINISMYDTMRFDPARIDVKAGETVRLHVENDGRIRHELVLGSVQELKEHAGMMRRMPGMKHAEANAVSLEPGVQGDIVWRFGAPATVEFACLEPGHMQAGMVGRVVVR